MIPSSPLFSLNGFRGSRSSKFQKNHDFSVIVCVLIKSFHIFVGNYVEMIHNPNFKWSNLTTLECRSAELCHECQ